MLFVYSNIKPCKYFRVCASLRIIAAKNNIQNLRDLNIDISISSPVAWDVVYIECISAGVLDMTINHVMVRFQF